MSFPKMIFIGAIVIFAIVGVTAYVKKGGTQTVASNKSVKPENKPKVHLPAPKVALVPTSSSSEPMQDGKDFPKADRISQLFTTGPTKLPIVETVVYTSQVAWLKGRPAWVADYASHYSTSRHFIARSLNGKSDYFTQKVSTGSQFNVFRKDRNVQFYLLVDLSLCKLGFYYIDLDTNERVLLKTYQVGVGKLSDTASGCLTPLGKYKLGNKVAVYKPDAIGHFHNQQIEMVRVFGTRWIPLGQELDNCTALAKGYGIHSAPWTVSEKTGQLAENRDCIGKYESDGSIRLLAEDMEELFSIIISKPTVIEIVKHIHDARLPGVEVVSPMRS